MSIFPTIVMTGVDTLVFSYGQYRYPLAINLASSVPRTILYFALVPIMGMTGVAISYTIGAVLGFVVSILVANRIGLSIFWRPLALTLILPLAIAFLFAISNVNYIIGIVSTIVLTYLLLMKLHIIERTDGLFFIELMPDKISKQLIMTSKKFEKI